MHLPFTHDIQVLAYFLYEYYANVETRYEPTVVFTVEKLVEVNYHSEMLEITWISSEEADFIADSVCLMVMQVKDQPSVQLVKLIERAGEQRKEQEFKIKLGLILGSRFDKVVCGDCDIQITHKGQEVTLAVNSLAS